MFAWVNHMSQFHEIFDNVVAAAAKAGKSPSQIASECSVSPQRLFNWRRRGVPALQVNALSKALGGALMPHEIRPDLPGLFPVPDVQSAAA